MNREKRITEIDWQGIKIDVHCTPSYSPYFEKAYGYPLVHIELYVTDPQRAPLPITETGYRSHFTPAPNLDEWKDEVEFITAWLDDAAQSPEWIKQYEASKQGNLF